MMVKKKTVTCCPNELVKTSCQLVSFKYMLCLTVILIKVNIIHLTQRDGKN
jgi:hypothetical protein